MGKNPIHNLIERLQGSSDSVLLVYENNDTNIFDVKYIYDLLLKATVNGTLVISGDNRLNQNVFMRRGARTLSNQQRIVIASQKLLQLLLLEDNVHFAKHPGLVVGSLGKYSRFFARALEKDFPYGETSIYNDMYDLNTIVISIGKPIFMDCIKFACSKLENPIIKKNASFVEGEVAAYLDYHCDVESLTQRLLENDVIFHEKIGATTLYAGRYRDIISFAIESM